MWLTTCINKNGGAWKLNQRCASLPGINKMNTHLGSDIKYKYKQSQNKRKSNCLFHFDLFTILCFTPSVFGNMQNDLKLNSVSLWIIVTSRQKNQQQG